MRAALRKARRLLERTGWVGPAMEPFCRAHGPGVQLNANYENTSQQVVLHRDTHQTLDVDLEGLDLLSVQGALQLAGAYPEGWAALERIVGEDLQQWLQEPKRTAGDVLRVFTTAILRSARETS